MGQSGVPVSGPSPELLRPASRLSWLPRAQIPEAWLLLANVVVLLMLVPVKDRLLDPWLLRRRLLPSALQKMALGMCFSFASVLVAGVWARVQGRARAAAWAGAGRGQLTEADAEAGPGPSVRPPRSPRRGWARKEASPGARLPLVRHLRKQVFPGDVSSPGPGFSPLTHSCALPWALNTR